MERNDFAVEWYDLGMFGNFSDQQKLVPESMALHYYPNDGMDFIREAIAIKRGGDSREYASQIETDR